MKIVAQDLLNRQSLDYEIINLRSGEFKITGTAMVFHCADGTQRVFNITRMANSVASLASHLHWLNQIYHFKKTSLTDVQNQHIGKEGVLQ